MRGKNELGSPFVKRWFTRSQAAKACGISIQAWHNLERRGVVRAVPVAEAAGWKGRPGAGQQPEFVIRAEDVARVKNDAHVVRLSQGQIAAAAFDAFERGRSIIEVVIMLKLAPGQAEELHASWRRVKNYVLLPGTCVEKFARLGFSVSDEASFVAAAERLLDAARRSFRTT